MSYTINRQGDTDVYGYVGLYCDKLEDVETLPNNVTPGSYCLCREDSSVWVFGEDGKWDTLK